MNFARLSLGLALVLMAAAMAQPASAQRRRFAPAGHPFAAARAANRNAAGRANVGANRENLPPAQNAGRSAGAIGHAASSSSAENEAAHPSNQQLFSSRENSGHPGTNNPSAPGAGNWHSFGNQPGGAARVPPAWVQKLGQMSPQEREHFLQNNQRFQSLTPQQQQRVRQRVQAWQNLSPAEQDRLRDTYRDVWQRMTPQQQQHVKNDLLPKWQQMSPDRRSVITGRLHVLQGMTPEQRQAALNDPKFMQGLTPDEQGVLRDLNSLRNP